MLTYLVILQQLRIVFSANANDDETHLTQTHAFDAFKINL